MLGTKQTDGKLLMIDHILKMKNFYKKNEGFSKFKKENFKGIYLISSKVRSYLRKVKKYKIKENNEKI